MKCMCGLGRRKEEGGGGGVVQLVGKQICLLELVMKAQLRTKNM